jgi:hypothetical protein
MDRHLHMLPFLCSILAAFAHSLARLIATLPWPERMRRNHDPAAHVNESRLAGIVSGCRQMRALRTVVLIGAMSILTNPALAQDWATEPAGLRAARGIATQFGTYDSHEIDTVNLYSGTLTLANPIGPELPSGAPSPWG